MTKEKMNKIIAYVKYKIKSCPFCGDKPCVMINDFHDTGQFRLSIECCANMAINIMYDETPKKESKILIKMWNTRKGCKC